MACINVCFYSDHSSRPNMKMAIITLPGVCHSAGLTPWPRYFDGDEGRNLSSSWSKNSCRGSGCFAGLSHLTELLFWLRGFMVFFFFSWHSCTSTESIRQPEDFQHISRLLNSELLLTLLSSRCSNPPLLFYNHSLNFSWEFPSSRVCPALSITTSFHQDFSYRWEITPK